MTTITLPPELETAVVERARQNGTTPELLALDSLRREFLTPALPPEGKTLADFLGDFIGCLDSGELVPGGARMSEQDGEEFAEGMAEKQTAGQTLMLIDTGPLVALLDKRDPNHAACLEIAQTLPPATLQATWPCFTEAMYFLGKTGGQTYQNALWQMRRAGRLELLDLTPAEADRMDVLMARYANVPMD